MKKVNKKNLSYFVGIIAIVAVLSAGVTFITSTKAVVSHIHAIALTEKGAQPDIVRLPIGDYAQFNSNDGQKHDIAQGHGDSFGDQHQHDASGLESGSFQADEGYKVQFKKVGIYDFHDHLHPAIHVTVIAYDPNEKKTTTASK